MASAACPTCRIALVEADNDDLDSLAALVDALTAKNSPVKPAAISNSYGAPESSESVALDAHFDHPGVPIVASAGDEGLVEFPASSSHVVAVGGTTLTRQLLSARGWSEKRVEIVGNRLQRLLRRRLVAAFDAAVRAASPTSRSSPT